MKKLVLALSASCISALTVQAAPTLVGLGAFDGSETLIDFNSLTSDELITNQFAGSGVTFSGSLYGHTESFDLAYFTNHGGVIASNWIYNNPNGPELTGLTWEATFSSSVTRAGFWLNAWQEDDVLLDVFQGAALQGNLVFDVLDSNDEIFVGVQSLTGFDRLSFTLDMQNQNGYFAIDDFRFGGTPVPEPSTWVLLGTGLLGLATYRRYHPAG